MAKPLHTEARFNDDEAAREHLEAIRWPDGPVCPHCGCIGRCSRLNGASHRKGLLFCGDCRKQFSVTVGTVFERSKIALHLWVYATHLMCASKKGISSKQIERMLGVTYKTAWFMTHRIREAMTTTPTAPLGGPDKIVEADETYWGNVGKNNGARGYEHKMKILSLVERDGNKRSFHVASVNAKTLRPILQAQIDAKTHLMTDDASVYKSFGKHFAKHSSVNHSAGEYVRDDVTTNTVESSFAIFKRGLYGIFHNVSEKHLQRYTNEFDFRWNYRISQGVDDVQRAEEVLKGIGGKRLTYRRLDSYAEDDAQAIARIDQGFCA
jgi:transposase-like protein